jgi:hypothetical protein
MVIYSSGEAPHADCHALLLRKMTESAISSFCLPNHLGEVTDIIHLDHLQWKEIKYMTPISEDLGIGNKYIVCLDLKI